MAQRRYGKPVGETKIRTALKEARNIDDVFRILEEGRFNLTSEEERKVVSEWKSMQASLKIHGVGAYAEVA